MAQIDEKLGEIKLELERMNYSIKLIYEAISLLVEKEYRTDKGIIDMVTMQRVDVANQKIELNRLQYSGTALEFRGRRLLREENMSLEEQINEQKSYLKEMIDDLRGYEKSLKSRNKDK